MANRELRHDQWLTMPREELLSFCASAYAGMFEEQAEPLKGFRHLMNYVLLMQLDGLRGFIEAGKIEPDTATTLLRSDFGFGYLFGLAANYADALSLPQQSVEARTAIFDVHFFTFGDEKNQVIAKQNARTSFSEEYMKGVKAADRDANSFKTALDGGDGPVSTGLVGRLL